MSIFFWNIYNSILVKIQYSKNWFKSKKKKKKNLKQSQSFGKDNLFLLNVIFFKRPFSWMNACRVVSMSHYNSCWMWSGEHEPLLFLLDMEWWAWITIILVGCGVVSMSHYYSCWMWTGEHERLLFLLDVGWWAWITIILVGCGVLSVSTPDQTWWAKLQICGSNLQLKTRRRGGGRGPPPPPGGRGMVNNKYCGIYRLDQGWRQIESGSHPTTCCSCWQEQDCCGWGGQDSTEETLMPPMWIPPSPSSTPMCVQPWASSHGQFLTSFSSANHPSSVQYRAWSLALFASLLQLVISLANLH